MEAVRIVGEEQFLGTFGQSVSSEFILIVGANELFSLQFSDDFFSIRRTCKKPIQLIRRKFPTDSDKFQQNEILFLPKSEKICKKIRKFPIWFPIALYALSPNPERQIFS